MKQSQIKQVITRGRIIQTPHIKFYCYSPPSQSTLFRPAVVVSKKINPSSVARHKYQRWMRELLRQLSPPKNNLYVLVAKPSLGDIGSLEELISSISEQDKQKIVS